MNHRLLLLFSISICLSVFSIAQKTQKQVLPNVIYIYLDDMGYGELGSYGQQKIKTPNSLKERGKLVVETGVEPVNGKSRIDLQSTSFSHLDIAPKGGRGTSRAGELSSRSFSREF